MIDYTIVGDTKEYGTCLIYVCGHDKSNAEKVLNRMLTDPDKEDKRVMKTHTNIRIKEQKSEDCWWNDPFLAN